MNRYQIVMPPSGEIIAVSADRMQNVDGDLKFFIGNDVVGEARYWQAWTLIGQVPEANQAPQKTPICELQSTTE